MENLKHIPKPDVLVKDNNTVKIHQSSYRGIISIDQEMTREIAINFLQPLKQTVRCQKGFVFVKN